MAEGHFDPYELYSLAAVLFCSVLERYSAGFHLNCLELCSSCLAVLSVQQVCIHICNNQINVSMLHLLNDALSYLFYRTIRIIKLTLLFTISIAGNDSTGNLRIESVVKTGFLLLLRIQKAQGNTFLKLFACIMPRFLCVWTFYNSLCKQTVEMQAHFIDCLADCNK